MDFQLWEHQSQGIEKLREMRKRGIYRIVLQLPPGGGKTEIAAELTKSAREKGRFVAFTVPFLSLIDQTVARFELRGVTAADIGVLQAKHARTNEIAPIQVCSAQTLKNRAYPLADVVFVDECHLMHKAILAWMKAEPTTTFVGLSATPWTKGMADHWQELIVVETIRGLIDKGVLSPFRTFAPPLRPNTDAVPIDAKTSDFQEGALSEVMRSDRLVADCVATWLEKASDRPTLCYAVDRAHAAVLTAQFDAAGVRAEYVDAFTETDERATYIEQLRTGETQVVVSIGTLTTGVDVPWVSCISFVRPTWSKILFVQSICRGLRAYDGKTDCLILDHTETTRVRLGQVTEIGFAALRPGKTPKSDAVSRETPTPLPRECSECHFMIPPRVRQCPECGFVSQPMSLITYDEGELEELGQGRQDKIAAALNKAWTTEDKARFYGGLKWFGEFKGYSPKWPDCQYRDRFGVWPDYGPIHNAPAQQPDTDTKLWIRQQQIAFAKSMARKRA